VPLVSAMRLTAMALAEGCTAQPSLRLGVEGEGARGSAAQLTVPVPICSEPPVPGGDGATNGPARAIR
jgi:hypothetical protein